MNTLLPALVLLAALLQGLHLAEAGGGSAEYNSQCQNSHQLVTPSVPEEPTSCPIVEALHNCSASLDVSVQASLSVLIQTIEGVVNSTNLTADQLVSRVAVEISLFFQVNVNLQASVGFCPIYTPGGSEYGCVRDVVQVGVQVDSLTVEAQLTLDVGGSCPLFVALENACAELGNPSTTTAVNQLIASIRVVLQSGGYTNDQLLALVAIEFQTFFSANPSLVNFVLSVELGVFGQVSNLVGVCNQFNHVATVASTVNGTTTGDCPLLIALNSIATNPSYGSQTQALVQQLIISIEGNFAVTVDFSLRLNYVSTLLFDFCQSNPSLVQIILSLQIDINFGDLYLLLSCSHFCTENNNCQLVNDGCYPVTTTPSPTTLESSTVSDSTDNVTVSEVTVSEVTTDNVTVSEVTTDNVTVSEVTSDVTTDNVTVSEVTSDVTTDNVTTEATTPEVSTSEVPTDNSTTFESTPESTSTAISTSVDSTSTSAPTVPTTTTRRPADCSKKAMKPLVVKKKKHFIMIDCIKAAQKTWNATLILEFSSTFTKVKKCLKKNPKGGYKEKMKKLPKYFARWNQNDKATRQIVLDIVLTDGVTPWGTIGQFCNCAKPGILNN